MVESHNDRSDRTGYRRRSILQYGGALAITGGLAGCTGGDGSTDASTAGENEDSSGADESTLEGDDSLLIGFMNTRLSVTYFTRLDDGFNSAIASDLQDHPTDLEISELEAMDADVPTLEGDTFNAEGSASNQVDQLETFLNRDPDAIVINPVSPTGSNNALEQYEEAGIPVINIDTEVTEFEPNAYIASRNVELGERSGELLVQFLEDAYDKSSYNVVELQGTAGDVGTRERHEGFRTAIEDASVEVIGDQHADFASNQALSEMEDMITRHGDAIDGVYAHNDAMVSGAYEALQNNDMGPIPMTGIDGSELWVEKFDEYDYYGTIAQQPENMAKIGVEKAVLAVEGHDLDEFYPVPGIEVTSENAQEFLDEFF